jgi:hypothetical protein
MQFKSNEGKLKMENLSVRGIDDEVVAEFREFVLRKYGKKHTAMGLEVEAALRMYLGVNTADRARKDTKKTSNWILSTCENGINCCTDWHKSMKVLGMLKAWKWVGGLDGRF